jgi:hypothetical protein
MKMHIAAYYTVSKTMGNIKVVWVKWKTLVSMQFEATCKTFSKIEHCALQFLGVYKAPIFLAIIEIRHKETHKKFKIQLYSLK